jgi:large subunit ribosomal protein L44e
MKFPKKIKRYCKYCKKHTEQAMENVSSGHKRGTMKKFSIERARLRGRGRGLGNLGKWGSKPAVGQWKRKTKNIKKTNLMWTCTVCKKSTIQKKGHRAGKLSFEDKTKKEDKAKKKGEGE